MTIAAMYFAMGFLAACLGSLTTFPLIQARAERLTRERLKRGLPISIGEILAEKDLLRADFAMTVRRLELRIEQLTKHAAMHLVELGRKTDVINKLNATRDEQKDEILDLRAQVETLKERLAIPALAPGATLFGRPQGQGARKSAA